MKVNNVGKGAKTNLCFKSGNEIDVILFIE